MARRVVTPLNESRLEEVRKFKAKLRREGFSLKRLRNSLLRVCDYHVEKEQDDFVDGDHNGTLEGHIYSDLIVLYEFMKGLDR